MEWVKSSIGSGEAVDMRKSLHDAKKA